MKVCSEHLDPKGTPARKRDRAAPSRRGPAPGLVHALPVALAHGRGDLGGRSPAGAGGQLRGRGGQWGWGRGRTPATGERSTPSCASA